MLDCVLPLTASSCDKLHQYDKWLKHCQVESALPRSGSAHDAVNNIVEQRVLFDARGRTHTTRWSSGPSMIFQAEVWVSLKRSIPQPLANSSLQNLLFSSFSRAIPSSSVTFFHIVVAITTFGIAFDPNKFGRIWRFFSTDPFTRLSEILCR